MAEVEDNLDLFPDIELSLEEINQCLAVNKKANWESTLVDVLDLTQRYFIKHGFEKEDADKHAVGIVWVLSNLINGQPLYFPSGKKLEAAIRNQAIYQDFGQLNMTQMIQKYNLTKAQIYNIVADQKALPMNRTPDHPELFPVSK